MFSGTCTNTTFTKKSSAEDLCVRVRVRVNPNLPVQMLNMVTGSSCFGVVLQPMAWRTGRMDSRKYQQNPQANIRALAKKEQKSRRGRFYKWIIILNSPKKSMTWKSGDIPQRNRKFHRTRRICSDFFTKCGCQRGSSMSKNINAVCREMICPAACCVMQKNRFTSSGIVVTKPPHGIFSEWRKKA